MTFTINERDIYFIVSIVLLVIQVYQRYIHGKLRNTFEDLGNSFVAHVFTSNALIESLQKRIEKLENKSDK